MKNYNEIMAKVTETELGVKELRELVEALIEENTMLREQLGMPVNVVNDNLSLDEAFNTISWNNSYKDGHRQEIRAFNCFVRADYKKISDFKGKSIYDLVATRNANVKSCAIMIVLLEHFGVEIDLNCRGKYGTEIKKVREELPKVRDSIIFTK